MPLPLRRGFSIVEAIMVVALIGLVVSLLAPSLARSRGTARQITALSNMRQLGLWTSLYIGDFKDYPPTIFPRDGVSRDGGFTRVQYAGRSMTGHWFSNAYAHDLLVDKDERMMLVDPGRPGESATPDGNGGWPSDFHLAECLYVEPKYNEFGLIQSPDLWGTQRFSSVRFPAQKGFVRAVSVYNAPGFLGKSMTCCVDKVPSGVVWCDLSGSTEVLSNLKPGVPNQLHWGNAGPVDYDELGTPVANTEHGVLGQDR